MGARLPTLVHIFLLVIVFKLDFLLGGKGRLALVIAPKNLEASLREVASRLGLLHVGGMSKWGGLLSACSGWQLSVHPVVVAVGRDSVDSSELLLLGIVLFKLFEPVEMRGLTLLRSLPSVSPVSIEYDIIVVLRHVLAQAEIFL